MRRRSCRVRSRGASGVAPKKFRYRGLQPLFEGGEFSVNATEIAEGLDIWVANAEGAPTMRGTASW